jgi:hypothetical protein
VTAADVGRRFTAHQQSAGALGDQRGVQRVVEVRVHRDDCGEAVHADARQTALDAGW